MVSVILQKTSNQTYYYLTHHNKSRTKREYLGKEIPADIEERKKRFLLEFYREDWHPQLELIHKNFIANQKKMPKSVIEQELKDFVIQFTYHTQRIEGSTLTRLETERLLRDGVTPSNKPKSDMIEAELAEQIFFEMLKHEKQISLDTVRYWHTKMFNKTKIDLAGDIRDYEITVRGSKTKFPPGDKVFSLLREFFKWYQSVKSKMNPAELAAVAHLKFVSIHPFGDGNGRISRLLMNCILDENRYPMLNIEYVSRYQYYAVLEKSNLKNDEMPFLQWFMKRYMKSNKIWL